MTREECNEAMRAEYAVYGRNLAEAAIKHLNEAAALDPKGLFAETVHRAIKRVLSDALHKSFAELLVSGIEPALAKDLLREATSAMRARFAGRAN